MKSLGRTKIKKLNPREGYLAPYIQLPWGYKPDLIGRAAEIFECDEGFFIKIEGEEFKLSKKVEVRTRLEKLEKELSDLKKAIEETAGLKGFEPLTYGLRVERKDALQSIAAQSQVRSVMFTEEDITNYKRYKTKGLTASSSNWIIKILNQMVEITKGELNLDSLNRLSDVIITSYPSEKTQAKYFIYCRNFMQWLYKIRADQRLLPLIATFEKPRTRSSKRLTSRIIVIEDIKNVITCIEHDSNLIDERKQNFISQIMFLSYTGQRALTMARITPEQIHNALSKNPPVLTVEPEQDKIRLQHYVPIHPRLIPYLNNLNETGFRYEMLMRYLNKAKISLNRTEGKFELKDLRKFFEQKSDEIGFTDANKNFIMSHGVSSVNWQSYKQFLPECVYRNYMEKWGGIEI